MVGFYGSTRSPSGLNLSFTGSAVVGHDTNRAANESIENTTKATIALVILILLGVYRSPLLAMVPLVTIALSVVVSLRLIAVMTAIPGLGFQVINITRVFVVVVLLAPVLIIACFSSLDIPRNSLAVEQRRMRFAKRSSRWSRPVAQVPGQSSSASACFFSRASPR